MQNKTYRKASFTLSRISAPASLQCGHRSQPGTHRSDAGKHRIASGYTVLNRRSQGGGPGDLIFFITTGTHRVAKKRRFIPGHHCSSTVMIRLSTVRTPCESGVKPA